MSSSEQSGEHRHAGSFAEGAETMPHAAEKGGPGSFASGQGGPDAGDQRMGSFAASQGESHSGDERMGSFADTTRVKCPACGHEFQIGGNLA